ncbi:MAG: M20/M25/M40 family metallo-hydrolase [Planctomycetota bacterium]
MRLIHQISSAGVFGTQLSRRAESRRWILRSAVAAITLLTSAECALTADGPFEGSQAVADSYAPGFRSITEADSRTILQTLVEGDMAGRGTGQEGFLKAARWYAEQLESYGFQPAGPDGSWFQNVPFVKLAVVRDKCSVKVGTEELIAAKSLGISDFTGSLQQSLPASFVALGDSAECAEGQFAGRLLVVQGSGRVRFDHPFLLKGKPAAVLIVSADARVRDEAVNQNEDTPSQIPVLNVTRSAANVLAAKCGVNADFFQESSGDKTVIVSSSTEVDCLLTVERESIDVPNVVAWYPGSDPALQHEHICIGCHLDHLGVQRGETYPGADDNGSGSTAVLQVARAVHANPIKPKRSVLLIAFCAEERGLLGSRFYVKNPLRPLKDMICMLNIDMIGRNEETESEPAAQNENTIHLVGSRDHSTQLHELTLQANQHVGFVFEYDEEDRVDGRSDHASFSEQGIPVTFLFGGFNPQYHKPTDTLEGINFSKIANGARLNYLTLMMASEHGRFQKNP